MSENSKSGLVLTRRPGDSIVIGKNVVVTVAEIKGKQVRLHVHAPGGLRIDRLEIRERQEREEQGPEARPG